jgi:hypothetical protein
MLTAPAWLRPPNLFRYMYAGCELCIDQLTWPTCCDTLSQSAYKSTWTSCWDLYTGMLSLDHPPIVRYINCTGNRSHLALTQGLSPTLGCWAALSWALEGVFDVRSAHSCIGTDLVPPGREWSGQHDECDRAFRSNALNWQKWKVGIDIDSLLTTNMRWPDTAFIWFRIYWYKA